MDREFWTRRWQKQETPWDLAGEHPLLSTLVRWFGQPYQTSVKSILIPGCGRAHDAFAMKKYFSEESLIQVKAIDFCEEAISEAKSLYPQGIEIVCQDFFHEDVHFDLIFDRAMFVALHPSRRMDYMSHCANLLNKGGFFAGIIAEPSQKTSDIPPFGIESQDFMKCVQGLFHLERIEHHGSSFLVLLVKP